MSGIKAGSVFCLCKRFPSLRDLIVYDDPYSIRSLKEVDQNPGYISCKIRCNLCMKFVDHLLSTSCFATKNVFEIRCHLTCTTPYIS